MTTTIMSSPVLHAPNSAHCSRNPSPTASPSLRPLASVMAKTPSPAPLPAPRALPAYSAPIQPASSSRLTPPASPQMGSSRSFARAPPVRPYASPLMSRGSVPRASKPIAGDTKEFAEQVVRIFRQRSLNLRRGRHDSTDDRGERKVRSLGGSASENWDGERAEFLVDIPVWSPGSFQDLSTLHALRDTTLAHTHTLIAYLQSAHSLPASYRLLARSAAPSSVPGSPRATASSRPASPAPLAPTVGWGCIRLCPGIASPVLPKKELKPHVRRSSLVMSGRSRSRSRSFPKHSPKVSLDRGLDIPEFRLDLDSAIADEPEEDESKVELREGYRSGGSKAGSTYGSDDETEEESADSIIAKEVERRKVKEGSAFLMTLYGQPALILT